MESPSCQKTLRPQGFISQKPPACAAFYDVLPWMSTVVLIPQQHRAIFAKYHSANAEFSSQPTVTMQLKHMWLCASKPCKNILYLVFNIYFYTYYKHIFYNKQWIALSSEAASLCIQYYQIFIRRLQQTLIERKKHLTRLYQLSISQDSADPTPLFLH